MGKPTLLKMFPIVYQYFDHVLNKLFKLVFVYIFDSRNTYSPVHSGLPFEHLGQSSLSVNKVHVPHVPFYSILSQVPGVQHLSLGQCEPRREKTGFLPMRKQRRRSASQ